MKIVIDIPETAYEAFKEWHKNKVATVEQSLIANGTPYEERPHGEWIIDGHHYKCSRCGKTLAIMFSETDDDDLIGCPFCLADMRGGNAR